MDRSDGGHQPIKAGTTASPICAHFMGPTLFRFEHPLARRGQRIAMN